MFKLVRGLDVGNVDERTLVELKVQRKWQEARDIVCLELVSSTGTELPAFEAGAFIELVLQGGAARSYSLANAPHERCRYVIAVLLERAGLGGSRFIHDEVNEGDAAGRLDMQAVLKRLPRLTHLYVCGPHGLRDSAMLAATREGWDAAQIHQESFGG